MILEHLERDTFISQTYTDIYDGTGGSDQFLRMWPVTSISQLVVSGILIQPASSPSIVGDSSVPFPGVGYRYEQWNGLPPGSPEAIELIGSRFYMGKQNVSVTYTAGYLVAGEPWTVPTGLAQVVVNQSYGPWIADNGVTYASGTPLVYVPNVLTAGLAIGQYSIVPPADAYGTPAIGTYVFAQADIGAGMLISYSYVPSTVEQCVLDLINEIYARRQRPGIRSTSIQGAQNSTYDNDALPKYIVKSLQPYKNVLPF
jgi:hypothetical protein